MGVRVGCAETDASTAGAAVSLYAIGQILKETKRTRDFYIFAGALTMLLGIARLHALWPVSAHSVGVFEVWAEMVLVVSDRSDCAAYYASVGWMAGKPDCRLG